MGEKRDLYSEQKRAKVQLRNAFQRSEHTVLVHYSCESFYDRNNPRSPRVTSIAVRNLESGQTKSFSIHLIAERRSLLDKIEQHYDQLEKEMLEDFFKTVEQKQHWQWLHWNMRDANYGFEALENRLKALGSTPAAVVSEEKRLDLSRILIRIYGQDYIGHPRIEKLMQLNSITSRDFLSGKAEADAFDEKEFVKLHQSTLRKVDVLSSFASRAHGGILKTDSSWWDINGLSVKALGEWVREHWLVGAVITLLGLAAAFARAYPALAVYIESL